MSILPALYFMLPAYTANLVPPLFRNVKFLDYPLDFGARINGKRLLGDHKTWRGLLFGTMAGVIIFWLQQRLTAPGFSVSQLVLFNYSSQSLLLGFLLSLGALLGDAVKSFVKRQIGISPGKPWYLFDQIDYIIGALALGAFVYLPSIVNIGIIFIASIILTIVVKHIGYYIGVNKVAW